MALGKEAMMGLSTVAAFAAVSQFEAQAASTQTHEANVAALEAVAPVGETTMGDFNFSIDGPLTSSSIVTVSAVGEGVAKRAGESVSFEEYCEADSRAVSASASNVGKVGKNGNQTASLKLTTQDSDPDCADTSVRLSASLAIVKVKGHRKVSRGTFKVEGSEAETKSGKVNLVKNIGKAANALELTTRIDEDGTIKVEKQYGTLVTEK